MMEKRKEAAALSYNPDTESAPKLIAKGKGETAEHILEIARELKIPVKQDPSLTELLGKLDIHQSIPEELYQAVAEVFAFVYQLDQKAKKK